MKGVGEQCLFIDKTKLLWYNPIKEWERLRKGSFYYEKEC